jgi:CRP-like cAMP-binding protein
MSDRDRLRILRMTKELDGCSDAQLTALLPFIDELVVPAGTRLAQEGRLCQQLLIVAAGELETCRQGRVRKLQPGDTFGWTAMYERGWHDATVTAASSAQLLVMGHGQFRAVKAVVSEPAEFSEPALPRSLVS